MNNGAPILLPLALILSLPLFAASDPLFGTWTPHLDKWKPAPDLTLESNRRNWVFRGSGGDSFKQEQVDSSGKITSDFVWIVDGGARDEARISTIRRRIDARHLHVEKKGFYGTVVEEWVISPDDKTLTVSRKGKSGYNGRAVDELYVYSRLPAASR